MTQPVRGGFLGGSRSRGGYESDRNDRYEREQLKTTDFSNLPPIVAVEYAEHPEVSKQSEDQVREYRQSHQMNIQGRNVPKPITTFDHAGWSTKVLKKIEEMGFGAPTPIQAQGWPMALSGRNMVGIAQTGSGKTLSYLLPALKHIHAQEREHSSRMTRGSRPVALVMAPTRELAVQIQEVARVFGGIERIHNCCVYGGAPHVEQMRNLDGALLVIATPGRLLDFVESGKVVLDRVSFLVLDEADRMLDMGFEPQIRKLLAQIRPDRQVLLWSATWPKAVQRLAHDMLGRDFIQVNIGSSELMANPKIKQNVILCGEEEKESRLAQLLTEVWERSNQQMPLTIIFTNKKRIAEDLSWKMRQDGWAVEAIHGDKGQRDRENTLRRFKNGQISVLVATDVAARGLDIKDVRVVVNYDFPTNVEDYVHRIGRTARGSDTEGASYAFLTKADSGSARELIKIMEDAKQTIPEELRALVPWRGNNGYNNHSNNRYNNHRNYQNKNYKSANHRFRPY